MATSSSYDFSIDRDTLIMEALEILNAFDPVDIPSADEIFSCSRTLNMMLKAFQNQGLHLWKLEEVHLHLEKDKIKYSLGSSGDNATLASNETAVKVAASATDTSLDVDSTADMTASDYIGVVLDSGAVHWTTVSSVTDSDTVVLTDAMPSAAAVDNVVYSYTNKAQRPTRIQNAIYRDYTNGNDVPMELISREEYWNLGVKTQEGTPNMLYFDPRRDDSEIRIYPEPTNVKDRIILICEYPFEDFDTGANTPDFPQEWYEAVTWNLAARLMYKYGGTVTQNRRREIISIAKGMLQDALAYDNEHTSYFMQPDRRYLRS